MKNILLGRYRINSNGCWIFSGANNGNGYGRMSVSKNTIGYAHRVSYEIHVGEIPPGMNVCHHCDVRKCINPEHLFLGTDLDNIRDAAEKGKIVGPYGNQKLTPNDVREIREMLSSGGWGVGRRVAELFDVSEYAISAIKTGKSWGWLK